ncbi:MAG: ASCH domain-containing protein [Methylotenera sp.]|jgi:uncharacterized protein YhfF|nr:ASCH domain-containing protein [Methylotenera sp.]
MNLHHDILEAAYPGQSHRFFLPISIGGTPALADEGAGLILSGIKTATSSAFWDYPDGRIPFAGALSVLLDGRDQPVAIIETTGVMPVRYCDVTQAMALAYGEGERTLASWHHHTGGWYRAKAAREGQSFSDETIILWETLAVARRLSSSATDDSGSNPTPQQHSGL